MRIRNPTDRLLNSSSGWLSVCMRATTPEWLNKFSPNLILAKFPAYCWIIRFSFISVNFIIHRQLSWRNIILPKYSVEWLTLLIRIREVTGSNLGPEIDYPDRFFVISSVPPGKCRDSALKFGHDRFLYHILSYSFIILSFDADSLRKRR
jgi:hypothetical protein